MPAELPSSLSKVTLTPPRSTWIEVDAGALRNNLTCLRARLTPACRVMAVVKANAYGHGAVQVATTLAAAGVDYFAVAALGEALELRAAGITLPVLVLGYTPAHQMTDAIRHSITLTVYDEVGIDAAQQAAQQVGARAMLHLKVNTGMNRLGAEPEQTPALVMRAAAHKGVLLEGIFTHFATSDSDLDYAAHQFARFQALLAQLDATGIRPPIAHAANSAAALSLPATHLDMVRAGIILYGLDPDVASCPVPADFRPALAWKAQVTQVRDLRPGDPVSYGREFVADRPMTVAVIPVGYADGFPRRPHHWGHVLIHGRPAPILGRVCMDQSIVDVSAAHALTPVHQGDEAVLIGRQGHAAITAADAAARLHTINYDVVSRILGRVPRLLVEGE